MRARRFEQPIESSAISASPGAYALEFVVHEALELVIGRLGMIRLAAGLWCYCGSARGNGGLRARVGRHLQTAREGTLRPHWHVDRLLARDEVVLSAIRVVIGGDEHELVARYLRRGFQTPIVGFGASDCRQCRAHLVYRSRPSLPAGH